MLKKTVATGLLCAFLYAPIISFAESDDNKPAVSAESIKGKVDLTATLSLTKEDDNNKDKHSIPVLMAAKKQKNVDVDLNWLPKNGHGKPDWSTPLNDVKLFELVTHLLADAEGFADWTTKKVWIVYASDNKLKIIRCDLNNPRRSPLFNGWPVHRGFNNPGTITANDVKAVYIHYNNGEIIIDSFFKLLSAATAVSAIAIPLAVKKN